MKKKGFIETLVGVGIAVASICGTLYLLRDKIEENPVYKESISKWIDKIKHLFHSEISPEDFDPMDDIMDDFEDVEDLDELLQDSDSSSKRGYVTIKLHQDTEA